MVGNLIKSKGNPSCFLAKRLWNALKVSSLNLHLGSMWSSYNLALHILIASTKSQMYTSFPWVYLIKVWINSRSGKMQWSPKMSSKSNNFCKLDLATSFSIWSFDIFTMRVLYSIATRLHGNNMEIQWVLTFCKILLPMVSKKVASFYNSSNILGLLAK